MAIEYAPTGIHKPFTASSRTFLEKKWERKSGRVDAGDYNAQIPEKNRVGKLDVENKAVIIRAAQLLDLEKQIDWLYEKIMQAINDKKKIELNLYFGQESPLCASAIKTSTQQTRKRARNLVFRIGNRDN